MSNADTSSRTFFQVIISTPIQMFIAWRIRVLSKSIWLAVVICILAVISLGICIYSQKACTNVPSGGGIWLTIAVTEIRRFARKPELHWPALTWLLASAIADVLITASLTFSLVSNETPLSSRLLTEEPLSVSPKDRILKYRRCHQPSTLVLLVFSVASL